MESLQVQATVEAHFVDRIKVRVDGPIGVRHYTAWKTAEPYLSLDGLAKESFAKQRAISQYWHESLEKLDARLFEH